MSNKIYDQMTSVFENSSTKLNYAYVNNEGDGRGYTCGRDGWTTADGDILNISKVWPAIDHRFGDLLKKLSDSGSDSTFWLKLHGFPTAWKEACAEPAFLALQDQVHQTEYADPAIELAHSLGMTRPLEEICFIDANVQHGFTGFNSLSYMASKNDFKLFGIEGFLKIRRDILLNPQKDAPADDYDEWGETQKEWSQSVGRVDALLKLVADGNWNLTTPFPLNPWGDEQPFIITGTP